MDSPYNFNKLRPRQNGRHFPDDIFKWIFLNENVCISINISLKFVPRGPINNTPTLVQVMTWRRTGDKPLSEPMLIRLPTHICVTRPQWVKGSDAGWRHHELCPHFRTGTTIPAVRCWDVYCADYYDPNSFCFSNFDPVCDIHGNLYDNACEMAKNFCSWVKPGSLFTNHWDILWYLIRLDILKRLMIRSHEDLKLWDVGWNYPFAIL